MLGMSYFFYEVNRAGRLPPSTRAPWRADTLKRTGGGSLDGQWEGGYFDAGDHNKFMLPQAYAVARLAWTLQAFPTALEKTSFDVSRAHTTHWPSHALLHAVNPLALY
jgi:endoglucanase